MAHSGVMGAKAELAHKRVLAFIGEHGGPEAEAKLTPVLSHRGLPPGPQDSWHLLAFQAEMMTALAEIVGAQTQKIAALEEKVAEKKAASSKAKKG